MPRSPVSGFSDDLVFFFFGDVWLFSKNQKSERSTSNFEQTHSLGGVFVAHTTARGILILVLLERGGGCID